MSEATPQAWRDYYNILHLITSVIDGAQQDVNIIEKLEALKVEVLDDNDRKTELMKIIDVDPNWTPASLNNKVNYLISKKSDFILE